MIDNKTKQIEDLKRLTLLEQSEFGLRLSTSAPLDEKIIEIAKLNSIKAICLLKW